MRGAHLEHKTQDFISKIPLGNHFDGVFYEAVDDMIFVYAKPHGSMFIWFSVMSMCTFRPLYVVYVVKKYK